MTGMKVKFLGWKIGALRKKKGLKSVMALARKIDPENAKALSASISGYEQGENIPSASMLFLISVVLGCDMTVFFKMVD